MSRIPGRTKYGKKKIRKEKKQKRSDLLELLKEYILEKRKILEYKEITTYQERYIENTNLMEKFKASEGSIKKALERLFREGLVGVEVRGRRRIIYDYTKIPQVETKELDVIFKNVETCPICSSKLNCTTKYADYTQNHLSKKECSNNCFSQKYDKIVEIIKIYDKEFRHNNFSHRSERGDVKVLIEKEIKFWKKNKRYIARNLLGEWED